jgi:hypothetical protein
LSTGRRLWQEYWDTGERSDIRWDAIHKLAEEQNGSSVATNDVVSVVANADATSVATSVKEDDTILRTRAAVAESLVDYKEAIKRSQAATQTANLAKDVQQRDDRQQARKRQQREKRERYTTAIGRWPTCPIMCGSKTCNGDPCGDLYPAEKFDHPHNLQGQVPLCARQRRQVSAVPLLATAAKKLSRGDLGQVQWRQPPEKPNIRIIG